MLDRQRRVPLALRCGVLLLCLGFFAAQTEALEHLHLDEHADSSCLVCASGDSTPLSELGIQGALPDADNSQTIVTAKPLQTLAPSIAPYIGRAPPANS